jgi:phosphoribosyl-dephospho-CoA transferase
MKSVLHGVIHRKTHCGRNAKCLIGTSEAVLCGRTGVFGVTRQGDLGYCITQKLEG